MEAAKKQVQVGTIVEVDGRQALVMCIQRISVLQGVRVRDSIEITYKDIVSKKVYTVTAKESWREAKQADI